MQQFRTLRDDLGVLARHVGGEGEAARGDDAESGRLEGGASRGHVEVRGVVQRKLEQVEAGFLGLADAVLDLGGGRSAREDEGVDSEQVGHDVVPSRGNKDM